MSAYITTRALVLQRLGLTDDAASLPAVVLSNAGTGFDITSISISSYDTIQDVVNGLDALSNITASLAAEDGTLPASLIDTPTTYTVDTDTSYTYTYTNAATGTVAALIDNIILEVEQAIEDACGVTSFTTASRDERYDGNGATMLVLRNAPVTAVSAVSLIASDQTATALTSSDYYIQSNPGILHRMTNTYGSDWVDDGYGDGPRPFMDRQPKWPEGRQNVRVQYTGGYTTIPDSMKYAATRIAAALYRDRYANPFLTSESLDGRSLTRSGITLRELVLREMGDFKGVLL